VNEILVLDIKDTPSNVYSSLFCRGEPDFWPLVMTNVFKIRHGKETHVCRTELATEKKGLLSQFHPVVEELAARRRKEREGENERRKSLWATGDVRPI